MNADRVKAIYEVAKRPGGPITWRCESGRSVIYFDVALESELDERLALSVAWVPAAHIYKMQLFASDRQWIYRFESNKQHHEHTCEWIRGAHVNFPLPGNSTHGEPETQIPSDNLVMALHMFAERLNIVLPTIDRPPAYQMRWTWREGGASDT